MEYITDTQTYTPNNLVDTGEDAAIRRNVDDVLQEIRGHLTKEELLCVSLYKNASGQRNTIHRAFLKKYYGKWLSSGAITYRKKQMFRILSHVGALLRYKKENGIDAVLRRLLTKRQFQILMLYERRKTYKEITATLSITEAAVWRCYDRALDRLTEAKTAQIDRYLELLRNVHKFSRKFQKK